jgi:hypothetical protein
MDDPLAVTGGVKARLGVALAAIAALWVMVGWALG